MRSCFIVLLILGSLAAIAQPVQRGYPLPNPGHQEKVYIHTDREVYLAGETLWFAAYVVDGFSLSNQSISRLVKVELLGPDNKPVLQARVELNQGTGSGSFYLPATLPSGHFKLVAYTQWMQNRPEAYFFSKSIVLFNTFRGPADSESPASPQVTFFPESGALVANLANRVGFRFSGREIFGDFRLVDDLNAEILHTAVNANQPGEFTFTPTAGKKYFLINAGNMKFPLPDVQENFPYIHSDFTKNTIKFNVVVPQGPGTLVIHSHQKVLASFPFRGALADSFNTSKLSTGIVYVTLFNSEGIPLAERVHYHYNEQTAVVSRIASLQDRYRRRQKAGVQLQLPTGSHYSLAVYKEDSISSKISLPIGPSLDIAAELGLANDELASYFSPEGKPIKSIELVLLTSGARKFNFRREITTYPPEVGGIMLRAKVSQEGRPKSGVRVYFATPSRQSYFTSGTSDEQGIATVEIQQTYGSQKMYLVTDLTRDSTVSLTTIPDFHQSHPFLAPVSVSIPKESINRLEARSVALQLYDVFHPAQHTTYIPQADSLPVYGKADEYYPLDDYTRFPVMEEVFREIVKGVYVRKRQGDFRFRILNDEKKELFDTNPLVLVDGLPVFNINKVMEIDPLTVKRVDIIKRRFYRGSFVTEGVVSLKTYQGDLGTYVPAREQPVIDFEGLQEQRIFYSPDYTNGNGTRLPDNRYLLFWQCGSSETNPVFYTSDIPGTYHAVLQGITEAGIPFSGRTTFVVD